MCSRADATSTCSCSTRRCTPTPGARPGDAEGAVAKFAAAGKGQGKKDLGMIATAYGDVYVGQIAMGADMPHTVKVLAEAEAHADHRW